MKIRKRLFIYLLLFTNGQEIVVYTRMLQDYWEGRGFADQTVIVAGSVIIGMSFTLRVDCFLRM